MTDYRVAFTEAEDTPLIPHDSFLVRAGTYRGAALIAFRDCWSKGTHRTTWAKVWKCGAPRHTTGVPIRVHAFLLEVSDPSFRLKDSKQ